MAIIRDILVTLCNAGSMAVIVAASIGTILVKIISRG